MTVDRSLLVLVLAVAVVLALPITALAQPRGHADQDVAAEALFREGRRLIKDGKIADGCAKLDASERLADSVGTLLNLGDCREKNAQLATAWATFLRAATAARSAGDTAREAEARTRAHALEPRLSYLTVSVPAASQIDGLIIERDGAPIDAALWNQGVPIDAGAYEIRGRAPGHEPWSTRVEVQDGQKASVEVPRFKQITEMTAAVAVKPAVAAAEPSAGAPDDDDRDQPRSRPSRFTPLRDAAIASAAVGLVGIALGTKYGLDANDLQRQSNAICPGRTCSDAHGLDLNTSAKHDAVASDALIGAGGAAVAAGVVLWLVGAPHVTASVAGDHVSVAFAGRF